jgi:hypothetical protein
VNQAGAAVAVAAVILIMFGELAAAVVLVSLLFVI